MRKALFTYVTIAFFCLFISETQAQFGGFKTPSVKDVKKSVEKEVKDAQKSDEDSDEKKIDSDGGKKVGSTQANEEQLYYTQLANAVTVDLLSQKPYVIPIKGLEKIEPYIQKFDLNLWKEKYSGKKSSEIDGDKNWDRVVRLVDGMINEGNNYVNQKLDALSRVFYDQIENTASPADKDELFNRLFRVCKILQAILPDNEVIVAKIKEVDKVSQKNKKQLTGIATNSVHAGNIKKILYSNKLVDPEKAVASDFKTRFSSNEAIFCTVYLDAKLSEMHDDWHKDMEVDVLKGEKGNDFIIVDRRILITRDMYNKPYFQFALIPDEEWIQKNYKMYADDYNDMYVQLFSGFGKITPVPQVFRIVLSFSANNNFNLIKGNVSVDLSDGTERYEKLASMLNSVNLQSVDLPKAKMKNPALEGKMLSIMKEKSTVQEYKKAVITAEQWFVQKNELGVILHRYVPAVITSKNSDGKCYYQEFTFKQDYTGAGNYSQSLQLDGVGARVEMPCEKLN